MLSNRKGSPNGHNVIQYYKGCLYEINDNITQTLAAAFINAQWAELVEEKEPFDINNFIGSLI
jgi:hypothetical protein